MKDLKMNQLEMKKTINKIGNRFSAMNTMLEEVDEQFSDQQNIKKWKTNEA